MSNSLAVDTPTIGAQDRLGLTLFLAAALHAVIILGISFNSPDFKEFIPDSLDVILVQSQQTDAPEDADYLAQANQDGGGNTDQKARPQELFSAPNEDAAFGIAPIRVQSASPLANQETLKNVLTQRFSETELHISEQVTEDSPEKQRRANETIERSLEMARLAAEINRDVSKYAKRPRKKFIHARTRESASAAYMYAWVREVEQVGNLNYPDQARRDKLAGALVLVVGIKADGKLHEIILRSSSGHQILDDAAKRIVKLAAPYPPFPAKLSDDTDILYITRTWQFRSGELHSK